MSRAGTAVVLGTVAHELRNPLWRIAIAVNTLRRAGEADERLAVLADVIERQVFFMETIVGDMLEKTRIDAGIARLRCETLDVRECVQQALETCEGALAAQDQTLQNLVEPGLAVEGDRMRLRQVVVNLVANASRFSPRGAVIRAHAQADGKFVALCVTDEGQGIAADLMPRLFEAFVQGDDSGQFARGGLGLGLGIVREIVEMHGGNVTIASDGPGRGTQVCVRLPASMHAPLAATAA